MSDDPMTWPEVERELAQLAELDRRGLGDMLAHCVNFADEIGAVQVKAMLAAVVGVFPEATAARGIDAAEQWLAQRDDDDGG